MKEFLTTNEKGDRLLCTYQVDHLGPMEHSGKSYAYLFVVVDVFLNFVWLYPTKTTASDLVINQLKHQALVFGNPRCIILDRRTAVTSTSFKQYCEKEVLNPS